MKTRLKSEKRMWVRKKRVGRRWLSKHRDLGNRGGATFAHVKPTLIRRKMRITSWAAMYCVIVCFCSSLLEFTLSHTSNETRGKELKGKVIEIKRQLNTEQTLGKLKEIRNSVKKNKVQLINDSTWIKTNKLHEDSRKGDRDQGPAEQMLGCWFLLWWYRSLSYRSVVDPELIHITNTNTN